MQVQHSKLAKLKKRLQHVLAQDTLERHRAVIQEVSAELSIDPVDCAAALLYISQPHLFLEMGKEQASTPAKLFQAQIERNVRYRLNVGSQHQVDQEQLLAVLIAESGVDRKRITRVEIRDTYTLIDLPDGMPADIFQILTETTVANQKLNIKRVKPGRKKSRPSPRKQAF